MADQDLIVFLTRRFNEEEAALKIVTRPYRLYINDDGIMAEPEEQDADGKDVLPNRDGPFALIFDTEKRLREIAGMRKLLGRFRRATLLRSHPGGKKVGDKYHAVLGPVLEILAAAYSDHPDYREKWLDAGTDNAPTKRAVAPDTAMDPFEAADDTDRRWE